MGDSFVNSLQRLVARFILVVGRRKKKVTSQMVFILLNVFLCLLQGCS